MNKKMQTKLANYFMVLCLAHLLCAVVQVSSTNFDQYSSYSSYSVGQCMTSINNMQTCQMACSSDSSCNGGQFYAGSFVINGSICSCMKFSGKAKIDNVIAYAGWTLWIRSPTSSNVYILSPSNIYDTYQNMIAYQTSGQCVTATNQRPCQDICNRDSSCTAYQSGQSCNCMIYRSVPISYITTNSGSSISIRKVFSTATIPVSVQAPASPISYEMHTQSTCGSTGATRNCVYGITDSAGCQSACDNDNYCAAYEYYTASNPYRGSGQSCQCVLIYNVEVFTYVYRDGCTIWKKKVVIPITKSITTTTSTATKTTTPTTTTTQSTTTQSTTTLLTTAAGLPAGIYPSFRVEGGDPLPGNFTQASCQQACQAIPGCQAVDFNVFAQCYVHPGSGTPPSSPCGPLIADLGTTHILLVNCPVRVNG